MATQIRQGVFETNSSSTHSLVICTKEEFNKFQSEEFFIDWDGKFHPASEKKENDELRSYSEYGQDYEHFKKSFTTPSGDEMVAFGYFGYEG